MANTTDLSFSCRSASIAPNTNREISIDIIEGDATEILNHFDAKDILNHFDTSDLLKEMDKDTVMKFYGIESY